MRLPHNADLYVDNIYDLENTGLTIKYNDSESTHESDDTFWNPHNEDNKYDFEKVRKM